MSEDTEKRFLVIVIKVELIFIERILKVYVGSARPMRAETRQGQQGDHCVKHHVRRRPVPTLLARSLEVLEDGGEQAV